MSQEQYAVTPTRTNSASTYRQERAGIVTSRVLYLLIGAGIALILICIECILWILNPAHIFGAGSPHNLSMLLAILMRTPLLLLIPLLELIVVCTLSQLARKPLIIRSYIREVQRSVEQYRKLYTPLPTWNSIYKTTVTVYKDTPDPSVPNQPQLITISDLPQQRHTHLLLLGPRGTGKTTALHMYQHISLQKRSALMFGRDTLPIYIPLNRYSLFIRAIVEANPGEPVGDGALLDFLYASDLPGMHRLRPYVKRLIARGRVLFLCDGLDEVDQEYLPIINAELAHLMSQHQNRLALTGSEAHFHRQQELVQAANENLAALAILLPLDQPQMRSFIEQYIDSGASILNSPPAGRQYTAGQIMDIITHNPAGYQFSNPMLLLILLEIIDEIGNERAKRLTTRGRLLQEFVKYLVQHPSGSTEQRQEMPAEKEVLLFCGELAWAARYTHNAGAIQLPLAKAGGGNRERIEEIAASLQTWLDGEEFTSGGTRHQPNNRLALVNILLFAQKAALIDISSGGIISFRHPLIAAYLTGEYLMNVLSMPVASDEAGWMGDAALINQMLIEIENWAEPVTLWAGLLDDPFVLAKRFIADGQDGSADRIEALAMSLLCVGVAWPLAQSENSGQVVMPQSMEIAVARALRDTQLRTKLAQLFTLCAGSGAEEIYQSLAPMLLIDGVDEFVPLLDPIVVPGLLFKQLCDIVDKSAYDQHVKRLVRVLGHCGASAVPRAAELTTAAPGRSIRLRSAAINILGGTNEQSAVAPLQACLGDKDQFIMNRAINALIRLGPEHSLAPVLQDLDNNVPSPVRKQIHGAALKIVERFLDEPNPGHRLSPLQYQRVINVLMFMLTANYALEVQQAAREILVRQGRTAEKSESGEKAIDLLVQNLSSTEEGIARSALKTLEDIGPAATPRMLELLRSQPPEIVRVRIVEVLGYVCDQRALPYLLLQLADPVIAVQQQVALALRAYAPDSISGLIEVVLHGDNELVAARAEQVLGDIGEDTVRPIISALFPVEPERTHLLVHVLERLHDPQAIAPLIALLQTPHAGQTLLLAVIHTLGGFADPQVVPPLLAMLAHSNPLLYEGAINALSHLGEVALDPLIAALDEEETSSITSRVQRALLGMVHFPGEQLLSVLADAGDKQAEHIIDIFLKKGAEAAQILVANLFHPNRRVQNCVRLMVGEMSGQVIVPPLLDELNRPEAGWRAVIAEFLLRHPQEAIPPLVSLLDDPERGDAAEAILLEFGPDILPLLVPGLDSLNNMAQERSRRILVELVRQMPETVHDVVQIFNLSLPKRAHETLVNVLVNDIAAISIPTLLEGLEDAHLVGNVSEVLVRMVQEDGSSGEMALNALLESLRSEQRRHGAGFTLVDIGERAVPGLGRLITDPDMQVAQAAQNVLSEMGVPAFAFIWSAHSDTANPERREAARNIFRNMRTVVIKDELVELLKSNESDKISMALTLLLERIHDEAQQPDSEHEMIPALLEHVLTHSDEQASLRVLALLLLLGAGMVIDHMVQVLYDYPNHQERLIQAFLLLGEDSEEVLLDMLHDPAAPANLRAEAAGVLGMIAPHPDIREYARMTGEYGLWAGRTGVLQPEQLAIALRGLGGLLAGGHWDIPELQNLRNRSKEGSAERELYDILLGWRYSPRITLLENDLETERQEHKKDILNLTQQLLGMRAQVMELEQELEEVRQEHSNRGEELEQATREIDDLRTNLNQALHEKQVLRNNVQQLTQEKEKLQSRNNQWSAYCDRLEHELEHLRGSDKN
ncbi:MAG TPA: HEAT repeat domain-containing protein [Ktedonobacteraceae bacterium]